MAESIAWILGIALSIVLGSLPFGYWLALAKGVDLRRVGSGNIGATNAWRACGWTVGLPAFVLDVAKGLLPALGAQMLYVPRSLEAAVVMGFAAVVGHAFSPFLKFRGGKGVATGLGVVLAVTPDAAVAGVAAWAVVFALSRIVSLSSLVGLASTVITAGFRGYPSFIVGLYALLAGLIFLLHRDNISRLVRGEEYKFGSKSDKSVPPPGDLRPPPST